MQIYNVKTGTDKNTVSFEVTDMQEITPEKLLKLVITQRLTEENLTAMFEQIYKTGSWDEFHESLAEMAAMLLDGGMSGKDFTMLLESFINAEMAFKSYAERKKRFLEILTPQGMIKFMSQADPCAYVNLAENVIAYDVKEEFCTAVDETKEYIRRMAQKSGIDELDDTIQSALKILDMLKSSMKKAAAQMEHDDHLMGLLGL